MSVILDKVKYSYGSQFSLNINLQIPENSITILIGENGAGKTTLLKLLAGVLIPDTGRIVFGNETHEIGYIFQNPDDQLIQLSIEKELAFNLENQGVGQFQHVPRSSFMWPGQFALLIQDAGAGIFLNGVGPVTLRSCYPAEGGQTSMLRLRLP